MTNGSSSLAAISAGPTNSLAVTRQTSDKTLLYSVRNGSSWSQLSGISAGTTGLGITLAYQSTTGEHVLALRGTDTNHYVDAFLAGSWSLTEQVPAALGPSAAAMAPVGNNLVLAFAGNDTQLYTQARNNGSWAAAVALPGAHAQLSPALVVPTAGPELFLVWVNHQQNQMDDKKLFWATRTGGVWSPPAKISDNVFTDNAISAAALPNGDIIVAYRGTDTKAYSVYYSAGNNPPWAAAIPVAANSAIVGIPSVTAGINGALAELMYISASVTKVKHARLAAAGWYPAAAVPGPGAITAVAVMATP
ncbi:MAG TPA: hypothetical protein ENK23_00460 [Sorangium sp.]|nr:hypothetical protein [Sorangium sp.]